MTDTTAVPVEEAGERDGRTARRDRNRDAVLDALIELFGEDAVYPAPAEVAERSGVSLRSVYRYFEDMEALARAAMARHLDRIQPMFAIEDVGQGSLDARIRRLVAQRLRLYDAVAPVMRAAVQRSRTNEVIAGRVEERRVTLRVQIEEMFAPELADAVPPVPADLVSAIDVLLGFEGIEHLRVHRGLTASATARVLNRSVAAIVGAAAPANAQIVG